MPGRFVTPVLARDEPIVDPPPGAPLLRRKRLVRDLVYTDVRGRVFVVRAGFPTTGSSIPQSLWPFWPPFGEPHEPALWLHDCLYRHPERFRQVARDHELRTLTRAEADAVLREALGACGVPARWLVLAVRLGGWVTWRRYRQAEDSFYRWRGRDD